MNETGLQDLYQSVLVQHSKSPLHYGKLDSHTHYSEGYNALCGDAISIYLSVKQGKIEKVSFESASCAICKASASILLEAIKETNEETFFSMQDEFSKILDGEVSDQMGASSQEILAFQGIKQFPSRKNCALLPWETLHKALNSNIKD